MTVDAVVMRRIKC